LLLYDLKKLVEPTDIVYSFSLEAFKGDVSPLNEEVNRVGNSTEIQQMLRNQ